MATSHDIRQLGDYELINEIARGGMGVVYRARQLSLNRTVALKVMRPGSLASEAEVQRFLAEAEAAASLQHPNIVAIHEVGEQDGLQYFSMDYVEGQTLAETIRERPLSAETAARYVKTIAEAINYAHQRGILHRDLKPSNVLIDHSGTVRITDFGLAKRITEDSGLTASGAVNGNPELYATRAGRRPEGEARSGKRCLLAWRDSLRAADRPAAISGRDIAGHAAAGAQRPSSGTAPAQSEVCSRSGDDLPEVFREGAAQTLRVGARASR
jgi:serine/threonine protein kinase